MKKLLVLVLSITGLVFLTAGCGGKTVHTASAPVRFDEQGVWVGLKPDPNPVIVTITNHCNSDARVTVGGQETRWDGWAVPAGKTKSLKIQNVSGDFVLLFHFEDGSSLTWPTRLDYRSRVKMVRLVPKDWDESERWRRGGRYGRHRYVPQTGDLMMEAHDQHLRQFVRDQKRRFGYD